MKEKHFVVRANVQCFNIEPKKTLKKKFLSVNGNPTQNAVLMYMIYLTSLPVGWDVSFLNMTAVRKVREYFKIDYGFHTMILWGILYHCTNSKTSKKRHQAMSKAYHIAVINIESGVVITDVKLP